MRAFYDRDTELTSLKRLLAQDRPLLVILYGRRGAGKSTLLTQAFGSDPFYYYEATKRVLAQQLEDMQAALISLDPRPVRGGPPRNVEDILNTLVDHAKGDPRRPLVIVIDELPNLAAVDSGLLSSIAKWFKQQKVDGVNNLKLFVAGSHVSWMQREALDSNADLFSVRGGSLEIKPLNYRAAANFYPHFAATDRVRAWGIWGGLPLTLEEISKDLGLLDNVDATILRPEGRLHAEPEWLKYTDLREDILYPSIVRAIAGGERTPSKIATAVGRKSASEMSPYLDKLREAGLVERRPALVAGGESERIAQYVLTDGFLAFWYRFVDPYRSVLSQGSTTAVMNRLRDAEIGLDKYISEQAFEDVCRDFLVDSLAADRLPPGLIFDRVGRWWKGAKDEASDELDVVAYRGGHLVLIGECKWQKDPVGADELAGLDRIKNEAAKELSPHANCYRALFSRAGFTRTVRDLADDPNERILLFRPDALYW